MSYKPTYGMLLFFSEQTLMLVPISSISSRYYFSNEFATFMMKNVSRSLKNMAMKEALEWEENHRFVVPKGAHCEMYAKYLKMLVLQLLKHLEVLKMPIQTSCKVFSAMEHGRTKIGCQIDC